MIRSVLAAALSVAVVAVVGCGPTTNNANSKDAGPPPEVNPKGPPPMKGPGEGLPPGKHK